MNAPLSPREVRDLVRRVMPSITRAGAMARAAFALPRGAVDLKGDIDLVTDTDRAVEALLRHELAEATGLPVLGEEGGTSGPEGPLRWIVDPIDGTTNFAHRVPHFAISVGLAAGRVPLGGVVFNPVTREKFVADGFGATRNGVALPKLTGRLLNDALLVTGFPYDRRTARDNNLDLFEAFTLCTRCTRVMGSAALDLAFVSATRADAYWERSLKPWDTCAGVALVRASGGVVLQYDGTEYGLGDDTLVAAHAALAEQIVAKIAATRADA